MRLTSFVVALIPVLTPAIALADNPFGELGKQALETAKTEGVKAAKSEVNDTVVKKVNAKLSAEARKNQCSFKKDKDELEAGCDAKAKRLANVLIDVKKTLSASGLQSFKFIVTGHTDSFGTAEHNKELSLKRAAVMVRELTARGVPAGEIEAIGMGSEQMRVKPDNTEAKRAKNRRYEVSVKV